MISARFMDAFFNVQKKGGVYKTHLELGINILLNG